MITFISIISAILLIIIDQISKWWAATNLSNGTVIPVIRDYFVLQYTENRGVGFSLLQNQRWLFIPITLLITSVIIIMLFRSPLRRVPVFSCICTLLLAGAIGNLIDRIFLGYVIDFLYFKLIDFPIFNFADCCVVVGAFLLFPCVMFGGINIEDMPLRTLLFGIRKKENQNAE